MSLQSQLESLFFVSVRPLSIKQLSEMLKAKKDDIEKSLQQIQENFNKSESGLRLISADGKYQLATAGENSELIGEFMKEEMTGELTKPSLETLTIIAYRGPIAKAELEQIRGVNCSLILRNLLLRGLVEAKEDKSKMATFYSVTVDFMKFLGISDVKELPDFEKLNSDENLQKIINAAAADATAQAVGGDTAKASTDSTIAEEQTETANAPSDLSPAEDVVDGNVVVEEIDITVAPAETVVADDELEDEDDEDESDEDEEEDEDEYDDEDDE